MLVARQIVRLHSRLCSRIGQIPLSRNWGTAAALPQYTTDQVLPLPESDIDAKQYSPKIQKIVQEIAHLTLVEVADLNDLLKKTLKIDDVPMMSMGVGSALPVEEEAAEAEPVREKTSFTVRVIKYDDTKKIQLIKEIKNSMEGTNLVQAKKFVESLPQEVQSNIGKDEAEKLKAQLEAAGAVCEID